MGARFLSVRSSPAACSLERSRAECVEFGAEALEKRALSELRTRSKAAALRGMEPCFEAWTCGALPSASERLGDGLWKREALREVSLIQ